MLLLRVRSGDERAFAELFDRHARPVLAFARSRLVADAEDVAQAAFVLLWEKRRELELAGASALPWLLGTVRVLSLAAIRESARRRVTLDSAADVADAAPQPDRAAEVAELERLVAVPLMRSSRLTATSIACASRRVAATRMPRRRWV